MSARETISLRPCEQRARTARRFVVVTLRRWKAPELIMQTTDVVNELVAEAAARSEDHLDLDLVLVREPRCLRAEVHDATQMRPVITGQVNRRGHRASSI